MRQRKRWVLVGVFVALWGHVLSAQQARSKPAYSEPWSELDSVIPVAFSFSGGVSLGSYQSGVNWGLIEFMKLVRDSADYRRKKALPLIRIRSMTGASAGNINAVLSAIEYCDTMRRPSDSSLFWKAWVYTGWPQLFPADRSGDPETGLLDRRHFKDYIEKELEAATHRGTFLPDCHIPIGIVVTKLVPGQIELDSHVRVPTQRYVGLFEATVMIGGQLRFATPHDSILADRSLGARLTLYHEEPAFLDTDTVFELSEASSSFPIAFAPRSLTYRDPDCQLYPPPYRPCNQWLTDDFIDGGVFDNNPVSLALGLFRDLNRLEDSAVRAARMSRRARLLYVDPSAFRARLSRLADSTPTGSAAAGVGGFASVIHLVTGFVPSARTYELQTFTRSLVADTTLKPVMTATTRAHPVVGEHLDAFAAFLGRPFREFDFDAGISDAIYYISYDILCDPHRIDSLDRVLHPIVGPFHDKRQVAEARREACARKEYHEFVEQTLSLSPLSKFIIGAIANRTDSLLGLADSTLPAKTRADSLLSERLVELKKHPDRLGKTRGDTLLRRLLTDGQRLQVAKTLERATAGLLFSPRKCENSDLISNALCLDRFGEILKDFGTPNVKAILAEWAGQCRHTRNDPTGAQCLADGPLVDLVNDPNVMLRQTLMEILHRMREVEEARKDSQKENYMFEVKSAEMVFRSSDRTFRRGPEVDPSSIPPENWRWSWFHILPFYVGGGVGVPGFQTGWQPGIHTNSRFVAIAPLETAYFRDGTPARKAHFYGSVTPGFGFKFSNTYLNQLQAGLRNSYLLQRPHWTSQGKRTWEVGALLVGGKVRVTAYRLPERLVGTRSYPYAGTISLSDANGLLYWLFR